MSWQYEWHVSNNTVKECKMDKIVIEYVQPFLVGPSTPPLQTSRWLGDPLQIIVESIALITKRL